jgi:DNA repair protein RadA/Sms
LVDVVLSIEGDPVHAFRILRATKNRFGSTDEVGVFEMDKGGLKAVPNPSEKFLAERQPSPGSVITAVLEGSRVFLVEVQALVEHSFYPSPVRRASGFDVNRLQMLSAILSSRAGVNLGDKDIYVNVIGGMKLEEPAADLAVCAAILSATSNKTEAEPTIYFGEVGLSGEVRSVVGSERRIKEAERLGIKKWVGPGTVKNVNALHST